LGLIAPVVAVGAILAVPELAISAAVVVVVLVASWFQEDLVDGIASRLRPLFARRIGGVR